MSIIYQSKTMLEVLQRAKIFARSSVSVLLTGESGTGKELIAQQIHRQSPRSNEQYVRVNCAAFSENLIESEFFGHEAGAFTGAVNTRQGLFESAGRGTIFLDEIGELPQSLQAKLLRVLEESEFQRIGGNSTLRMHARIIAATNRDLQAEADAGGFRLDLFHRLSVLPLEIPPLRERREDIPALVQHFIQRSQSELEKPVKGVTRQVMESLCDYHWPGNVRQLRNLILKSCLLAPEETIQCVEFPKQQDVEPPPRLLSLTPVLQQVAMESLSLEEIEREVILHRIEHYQGNKSLAAQALGVSDRTLRNKMTSYRKLGYVG